MRWFTFVRCSFIFALAFGFVASASAQATKTEVKKKEVAKKPESATIPAPRTGPWMNRHETHLERVKPGNAELIFIGDSITQGWEGSGKEVWERYYGERKAVNLGIGGDRTQHVLWRLENGEVKGIKPKAAVVMIGTNNLSANSPDEIVQGVTEIIKSLRDKLPTTKILLLAIFPRGAEPTNPSRDKIKAINAKIAKLADDKHVVYLDIASTFLKPDGTLTKEIMPDFLHLSSLGYRLEADAIEPTLWKLLNDK